MRALQPVLRRCFDRGVLATAVLTLGCLAIAEAAAEDHWINVALDRNGGRVTASDRWGGKAADYLIDGDCRPGEDFGKALKKPHPHWICFHFARKFPVSKVVLHANELLATTAMGSGAFPQRVRLEVPGPQGTFREIVTRNLKPARSVAIEFSPVDTDYLRLMILASGDQNIANPTFTRSQLAEVEIFAKV